MRPPSFRAHGFVLVLATLTASACSRQAEVPLEQLAIDTNLIHAWREAELVRTSSHLPLAGVRGRANTTEARRRDFSRASGVLTRTDGDPPFAWVVGRRVSLWLDVLEPADRELTLRMASAVSGQQAVEVSFNGADLGRREVAQGAEAPPLRFDVPASMQRRGDNELVLEFERVELRKLEDEPVALPLAAAMSHVLLLLPGQSAVWAPPPNAGLVQPGRDPGARVLSLPARTSARLAVELPDRRRVVLRYDVRGAGLTLQTSLLEDGGRRSILHESVLAGGGAGAELEVELDLTPWAGRTVLLDFQTSGDAAGLEDGRVAIGPALVLASLVDESASDESAESSPGPGGRALARPEPPPSLLLIVLDALARRHVSHYGHERPTTPRLDGLAERGVSWTTARAPASYTLASVGTLLTGQSPVTHGVTLVGDAASGYQRLADDAPRLARALQAAGYRTEALVTNPNAASHHGYAEGFDRYQDLWRDPALWREGVDGAELVSRFAEMAREPGPFFAYVHVFEPHAPYSVPDDLRAAFVGPYDGTVDGGREWLDRVKTEDTVVDRQGWLHLHDLYDARVALADRVLGRLLDVLQAEGRAADTVVVVTSDHGEALGEHGTVEHGDSVFSEQIDVPLVMAGPGLTARTVTGPVTLADVAPTLLSLAGVEPPSTMEGIDVLSADPPADRAFMARTADWRPILSWTRGNVRLSFDTATRVRTLYDLAADPGETRDLLRANPATAALFEQELAAALCAAETARADRSVDTAPMDVELVDQLRAIGYTGSAPDEDSAALCSLVRNRRKRL